MPDNVEEVYIRCTGEAPSSTVKAWSHQTTLTVPVRVTHDTFDLFNEHCGRQNGL